MNKLNITPGFILLVLIVSTSLLYFFQKKFFYYKLFDQVTERSSHYSKATRSGGLAIFFTIFLISVLYYLLGYEIYDFSNAPVPGTDYQAVVRTHLQPAWDMLGITSEDIGTLQ